MFIFTDKGRIIKYYSNLVVTFYFFKIRIVQLSMKCCVYQKYKKANKQVNKIQKY